MERFMSLEMQARAGNYTPILAMNFRFSTCVRISGDRSRLSLASPVTASSWHWRRRAKSGEQSNSQDDYLKPVALIHNQTSEALALEVWFSYHDSESTSYVLMRALALLGGGDDHFSISK